MADAKKIGIGCLAGCGVMAGLALIAVAGGVVWLWGEGKKMQSEMADPELRGSRVLEVLGAESIPDGYYPVAAFSVPFVMKMAVLSDRPPDENGETHGFDQRGFIFVQMLGIGQDEQQLRDWFEGRTDDPDVLRQNGMHVDIDEILQRGTFPLGNGTGLYVTYRGTVHAQDYEGTGLSALTLIDCPEDERRRTTIWFGPDSEDLTGTPGDPSTVQAFLSHFRFCAGD